MKIAIVCDSFKESLAPLEVAEEIKAGFSRVFPEASYVCLPMADGGEGTVEALVQGTDGKLVHCSVTGPLGMPVPAFFGISGDGQTAIIEMAAAAGLPLLQPEERDPLRTTTYGVGQLVLAALEHGCRHVILGLGGSATNDGGAGFAQALGARLLDQQGQELPPGGGALARLVDVDLSGLDRRLSDITLEGACDVTSPLTGPRGASHVFGPQKGAGPEDVILLDDALVHYARILALRCGKDVAAVPGAGAAGGLGAGLLAFTKARLRPGVEIVADQLQLAARFRDVDLVITGEGRMDGQSAQGKAPMGVAQVARAQGRPVIAIVGSTGEGVDRMHQVGIDAFFDTVPRPEALPVVLAQARENVRRTAENVAAAIRTGMEMGRNLSGSS
ncbi:glycerate kinase [Parasaccharibacter sp. TMW2.1890]|uniref:glycerate kinase n=1 Tax=Parasaccharibacter sp. TMW2.1890 TaxID=2039289 RepID=UPI002012F836|nr:glycerate kinase [Parasaccharibacter sp. TMW2.1890]MCL1514366.1 glycerate kinase [Parasaccharibacter sp. TMW2.1890]